MRALAGASGHARRCKSQTYTLARCALKSSFKLVQPLLDHVGRIFDICVEKNHELPEDDPNRKYKGRVVFEGCFVRDEIGQWALFSENTSCPATMAAGKMCDAHGLLPANLLEVSDGESAYTQARLKGKKTWVRIPRDQWPPEWFNKDGSPKYKDPVVVLVLALYGHPDAGTFWEQHCEAMLKEVGYVKVKSWASVFRHEGLDLFLVVYVDDFKMSGPALNLPAGWELISKVIKMEEPRQLKRYLGCEHEFTQQVVDGHFDPRLAWTIGNPPDKEQPDLRFGPEGLLSKDVPKPKTTIRFIKYSESSFMQACVDRYIELCQGKYPKKLQKVDTPFLDESKPEFDENPVNPEFDKLFNQAMDVETINAQPGCLGNDAAAVLMKILYGARMGRYDLIRPVQALASRITKWNHLCDRKLHRIVSYVNSTLDLHLYGWVGDSPEFIELVAYCDADLAGDRTDSKSTSGVLVCLVGPRTYMPITGVSKKQTSVSKSTPEAEIVALDRGVSKEGMALAELWKHAIGKGKESEPMIINVLEDNESACRIVITGNNPNMRYMSRTQRIDISWLNEQFNEGIFRFVACPSHYQGGDIFTKACVDKVVWNRNLHTLGMFLPGYLQEYLAQPTLPSTKPPAPGLPPLRGVRMESNTKSGFNRLIEKLFSEYEGIVIDEEKGGKRCNITVVADSAVADIFDCNGYNRIVTLQVAPGYRNHFVHRGQIEGDSLCYVALVLNDLTPVEVDSRTGKWGQTRKTRDRTDCAITQRFKIALDAKLCGCIPVLLYRPGCRIVKEDEVNKIAELHDLSGRNVCACQCGIKGHGVVFKCFSTKEFTSIWSNCRMRGGDTLTVHDRSVALRRWLNNYVSAQP